MATGDTTNPSRVRFPANQRLDQGDADATTQGPRDFLDAAGRALFATPLATAAAPVGLIFTGGSITVNPTGASDGKVRINSELLVAMDADGRFLIKPAATTLDIAVPAGGAQHQLYAYFVEVKAQQAKRRAIPASSPYTEFTTTPYTKFLGSAGAYVRAGGVGSIVSFDTVGGVSTALVFLGIVSNAAGVVTFDGSAANNRLSTVKPASARPASSTANGSARTLHDLAQGALYELARTKFTDQGGLSGAAGDTVAGASSQQIRIQGLLGMNALIVGQYMKLSGAASAGNNGTFRISAFVNATTVDIYNPNGVVGDANDGAIVWSVLAHVIPGGAIVPQASTNYGAYGEPRQGLDAVDRAQPGFVTIGDGVSSFGTFDRTQFASDDLCLQAAIDAVASLGGGVVALKPGTTLSSWSGDVTVTTERDVVIQGTTDMIFGGVNSLINMSLGGFKIRTSPGGALFLRNLGIQASGTCFEVRGKFEARDVGFRCTGSLTASILTSGATSSWMKFFNCDFIGETGGAVDDTKVSAVHVPVGTMGNSSVLHFENCNFLNTTGRRTVHIDAGATVGGCFSNCTFSTGLDFGVDLSAPTSFIRIENATADRGWTISGCRFRGSITDAAKAAYTGVHLHDAKGVTIVGCHFDHVLYGVYVSSAGTQAGYFTIDDCRFSLVGASNATTGRGFYTAVGVAFASITRSTFKAAAFVIGTPQTSGYNIQTLKVALNEFVDSQFTVVINAIPADGPMLVEDNSFYFSGSGVLAPSISCETTTATCTVAWRGNQHSGGNDTASSAKWFGVSFSGYVLDLDVHGNTFRGIQSGIAYAGSTTAPSLGGPNVLIYIRGHIHRWKISGNKASGLCQSSTGANLEQVTCISVSPFAADTGAYLENCSISGNEFGDDSSRCSFLLLGGIADVGCRSLKILGNSHRTVPLVASTAIAAFGYDIQLESAAGANALLQVANNQWVVESSGGVLNAHWFVLGSGGAGFTIEAVSVVNEQISIAGAAFDSGKGFNFGSDVTAVRNLVFHGNVAAVLGAATNPAMYTEFTNSGSYAVPTGIPIPGSGSNWSMCSRIRNN